MVFLSKTLRISKLLNGIVDFRRKNRGDMMSHFQLLNENKCAPPVAVFFTCMDARIDPLKLVFLFFRILKNF